MLGRILVFDCTSYIAFIGAIWEGWLRWVLSTAHLGENFGGHFGGCDTNYSMWNVKWVDMECKS